MRAFSNKSYLSDDNIMTRPDGEIDFAGSSAYRDNYYNSQADSRAIQLFIHENTHELQLNAFGETDYRLINGKYAAEGNYDYEDAFNGTPFYKLNTEQQAEFFGD